MNIATGHRLWSCLITISLLIYATGPVSAQINAEELGILPVDINQEEELTYPAVFFQRYQPNTALDMVRQVPGFQLDDGGRLRGFERSCKYAPCPNGRLSQFDCASSR